MGMCSSMARIMKKGSMDHRLFWEYEYDRLAEYLTLKEAIIELFQDLEGIRTTQEEEAWIHSKYGNGWNSINTTIVNIVLETFVKSLIANT